MKARITLAALLAAAVALMVGTGAASALVSVNLAPKASLGQDDSNGADNGIHDTRGTQTAECLNSVTGAHEGTFTYAGPITAWPPNHKYRDASITLVDDDGDAMDGVTISVVGTHDQYLEDGTELNGSGNTTDDTTATDATPAVGMGDGSATANFKFRGERSGTDKTGRTYTFTANATTDDGTSKCDPVTFTATVPHDQGNHGTKSSSRKAGHRAVRR